MVETVTSVHGVPIRLTDERWAHITEAHCELAGMRAEVLEAIADPSSVYSGQRRELMAAREVEAGKYLVAVYREVGEDGFIITAFLTGRLQYLEGRRQVWPP
jgi:hypothetical protein